MNPSALSFDRWQFQGTYQRNPVAVEFHADGEVTGTGISFEDYARCQVRVHKLSGERRLLTPSWATNVSELRKLLARYYEVRALISHPRIDSPFNRLKYANRKMLLRIPGMEATLTKLCCEYTEAKRTGTADPAWLRRREVEIEGIDTQISLARRGSGVIVAIVHLFYGVGYDSVMVAAELGGGMKPPMVRQLLWRLDRVWRKLQDGTDRKPTEWEIRNAKARQYHREWVAKNPEKARAQTERTTIQRRADKEKWRAYSRAHYAKHRELGRLEARARAAKPEVRARHRERARRWAMENRERRREYKRQWYALARGKSTEQTVAGQ